MKWTIKLYKENLDQLAHFISAFSGSMGRIERRLGAAQYIEGLLLPGRRKLVLPIAERLQVDPQRLQQFVTDSPWDDQEVWRAIRRTMIPPLEPLEAWVIHERTWAKQGFHSVGVSSQEHKTNGRKARCQISLELLVSDGILAAPVAARLYLPKSWITSHKYREETEVPKEVTFVSKASLALQLLEQALLDGVAPAPVLADDNFGKNAGFRLALQRLGMEFFLQIDPHACPAWVYEENTDTGINLDSHHIRGAMQPLAALMRTLSGQDWHYCFWITPEGVKKSTRLTWREISLAPHPDAPYEKLERLWFVVDWPQEAPQPYRCYLARLQRPPTLARCLRLSRSHSYIDKYLWRFEKDLDLACYQGRSWRGFHHHLALSAVAYMFILSVEQRERRSLWPDMDGKPNLDTAVVNETERIKSLL